MKPDFDFFDPEGATVDLTSLIDVLFLLLTFFILAATFASPSINVALSEAKTAEQTQAAADRVILSINAEGELYHNQDKIVLEDIACILNGLALDIPVVFNVDEKAPFEAFITTMDEVKSRGFTKFLINARTKTEL